MINNALYPKPVASSVAVCQRLTVSTTVVQITTAPARYTDTVMFDVQNDDVWCTVDGSTPSSSLGHRLYAGKSYTWSKAMVSSAKFVRVNTDSTLQFSELQH